MRCEEIREMMPDLASGMTEMTPQITGHVAGCSACAGKLEEFRQTMALLDEWQAPEPSPYFDVRLQARLREEIGKLACTQPISHVATTAGVGPRFVQECFHTVALQELKGKGLNLDEQ